MPTELNSRAADLLEKAADGYESGRYGWAQGRYYDDQDGGPSYCAQGALSKEANYDYALRGVHFNEDVDQRALMRAQACLAISINAGRRPKGVWFSIPEWNDIAARTPGEVIDTLKNTAKKIRNGEIE